MSRARRRAAALAAGWVLVLAAVGALPACARPDDGEPARAPRHVVVVVLQSVGSDDLGAAGGRARLMPRLADLAARGVQFSSAWAASSRTGQALGALWTGRLPSAGGGTGDERQASPHARVATLPQHFAQAGFHTLLASNHEGLRAPAFTRGFHELELDSVPGRWDAARVTERALDLVDGRPAEARLLLAVVYADAGRAARHGEVLAAQDPPLDATLASLDAALGALVHGLAARGLLDDTLLVVTADHGEPADLSSTGDIGDAGRPGGAGTSGDQGRAGGAGRAAGAGSLDGARLGVPLVFHAPALLAPQRLDPPVSLLDLLPTLVGACGLRGTDDGASLLEARGAGLRVRPSGRPVFAEVVAPGQHLARTVVAGGWKLVEWVEDGASRAGDPWAPATHRALFDLGADPAELHDVAAGHAARVATLSALLARAVGRARALGLVTAPLPPPEAPPGTPEGLRQIGYF